MESTIASAVMLPEAPQPDHAQATPLAPASQKRRQPFEAQADQKRQRLSSIDANTSQASQASQERRTSSSKTPSAAVPAKERGREQRLFGAAIGALSRNSATAAQRSRTELEKRQRAQRELAEEANSQRKLERDAQRMAQRRREQGRFEADSVRLRHANLRAMAEFLRTEADPPLYYKPWELTVDEEDRIRDQIADAEDVIRRELAEHHGHHGADGQRERHLARSPGAERAAGANPPTGKEVVADTPQRPTANGTANVNGPLSKDPERREHDALDSATEAVSGEHAAEPGHGLHTASHEAADDEDASRDTMDDNGEEIVEAAEDTVIY